MLLQIGIERHAESYTVMVYSNASGYSRGDVPYRQPARDKMPMRYLLDLKRLRRRAGLTQQQLADRVSVEQPTIQRWEARKQAPDMANLDALAQTLGVHPGEMFRDAEMEGTPAATEAAIQELVAAALRSAGGSAPASSVRPIARGLAHGLALLLRNPAIRTNPDALAVAVHAVESQAPEANSPS